jgi:hypothetical protein
MANEPAKPELKPFPVKDISGWYVLVTWPDGTEQQVYDFRTELEAKAWIEHDSVAWLQKHPKTRHV